MMVIFQDITNQLKDQKFIELNRYKDVLLNSISHNLKTPLNCMMQMVDENYNE